MTEYTPDEASTNTALGRTLYQYDSNAQDADANDPDLPVRGFRFNHEYKDEGIHHFGGGRPTVAIFQSPLGLRRFVRLDRGGY